MQTKIFLTYQVKTNTCFFLLVVIARRFQDGEPVDVIEKKVQIDNEHVVGGFPICRSSYEGSKGLSGFFPSVNKTTIDFGINFGVPIHEKLFCVKKMDHWDIRKAIMAWRRGVCLNLEIGGIEKRVCVKLDRRRIPQVVHNFLFSIETCDKTIVDWNLNVLSSDIPFGSDFPFWVSVSWVTSKHCTVKNILTYHQIIFLAKLIIGFKLLFVIKTTRIANLLNRRLPSSIRHGRTAGTLMASGGSAFVLLLSISFLQSMAKPPTAPFKEAFAVITLLCCLFYGYLLARNGWILGKDMKLSLSLSSLVPWCLMVWYLYKVTLMGGVDYQFAVVYVFILVVIFAAICGYFVEQRRNPRIPSEFLPIVVDRPSGMNGFVTVHVLAGTNALFCVFMTLSDIREIAMCYFHHHSYAHVLNHVLSIGVSILWCVCLGIYRIKAQAKRGIRYVPEPVYDFAWCVLFFVVATFCVASSYIGVSEQNRFWIFGVFLAGVIIGTSSQILLFMFNPRLSTILSVVESVGINV